MTEEKYITAGQMLKAARTGGRRKREVSTISKLLCISEDYLNALERCDYKAIPELVYVLGFARNYAMELDLDPNEVVAKIKKEMGIVDEIESTEDEEEEIVKEEKKVKKSKKESFAVKVSKNEFMANMSKYVYKNWKWLTAAIIALVIAIVSVSVILHLGGSSEYTTGSSVLVPEPNYKQSVRERFGTENRETTKVIIQANQESWVKIEDARGNTVFSRVLIAGDVYYVPSTDAFKGTFGNAGGIDIWANGELIPKLGGLHERRSGVSMVAEDLLGNKPAVVTPEPTK